MEFKEIFPRKGFSLIEIINITSDIIERIINLNNLKQKKNSDLYKSFDSEYLLKTIPLNNYLFRVTQYAQLSSDMLIVALMYLDLFSKKNNDFSLNELNCHKLIFSSIVMSIKFYDDFSISNKTLSTIGGISVEELSEIETLFYVKIDFCLFLNETVYKEYREKLIFFQNKK